MVLTGPARRGLPRARAARARPPARRGVRRRRRAPRARGSGRDTVEEIVAQIAALPPDLGTSMLFDRLAGPAAGVGRAQRRDRAPRRAPRDPHAGQRRAVTRARRARRRRLDSRARERSRPAPTPSRAAWASAATCRPRRPPSRAARHRAPAEAAHRASRSPRRARPRGGARRRRALVVTVVLLLRRLRVRLGRRRGGEPRRRRARRRLDVRPGHVRRSASLWWIVPPASIGAPAAVRPHGLQLRPRRRRSPRSRILGADELLG